MRLVLCVLLCCTFAALLPGQPTGSDDLLPPLFYAVVSDTQKPENEPLTDFEWAVAQINAVEPGFVLMPGDLTNTGTVKQYTRFMDVARRLKPPVYVAPGNHEAPAGETIYRARFTAHTGQLPFYHQPLGGWHLIVLDSVRFVKGKLQHDGEIDAAQMQWLARELEGIPTDAPIILSLHHPFVYHDGLVNYPDLLSLFARHYLAYTVTAHYHRNRYHQDMNAVHHFTTGALSFSCSKACGIGYRWVSTVGRRLWTSWVETTVNEPLKELTEIKGEGTVEKGWRVELPPVPDGCVCLRLRYSGSGLTLRISGATMEPDAFTLPATEAVAQAFIPAPSGATAAVFECLDATTARAPVIESVKLYASTTPWQHYRLKAPGETCCKIALHSPQDGATVKPGLIPVLACIHRGAQGVTTELLIDGKPVSVHAGGFVAAVFDANGLQSKSHKFKNSLYVNDELVSLLPQDRDVLAWEQLGYPIAGTLWRAHERPWFMLTAGTATDGTGANPPENNEDFFASNVLLYDGQQYLADEDLPLGRSVTIGDNNPKISTYFKCHPTVSVKPAEWEALLHAWDATDIAPGEHTITVKAADKCVSISVTVE